MESSREAENRRLWARAQLLETHHHHHVEQTGVNGPCAGRVLEEEGACLLRFHTHLSSCMDSIVRETVMEITAWVKGNVGRIHGDVVSGGDKSDSCHSAGDDGSPAQGFEELDPGYADPGLIQEKAAVATRQVPEAACFVVDYELTVATTAMEEHPLGKEREEKEEEGAALPNPHLRSYSGAWVAEEGSLSPEESSLATAEPLGPALELASGQAETPLHSCSRCGRSFSKEWVLRRHMRRHSEGGGLEAGAASHICPHCNRSFKHRKGLVSHLHSHSGTKAYSCDVCEQRFTRPESLNKHRRLHSGVKPYSCSLCCRRFFRSDGLKSHMRTHEGTRRLASPAAAKLCMCAHCGKAFSSVTQVANHERTHTGEKPYECLLCHKKFRHAGALSVHRITHQRDRPHVCPRCPKSFRCSKHLKRHLVTHSEARPFVCDQCSLAFRTANELKGHKIRHSLQRTHGCPDCGKNFKTEYEVKLHRRAHNGERPYSCSECQRTFRRLHHLTSHRLTHTGEKPFACDVCQRRFIRAREMRSHKKKVHLAAEPSKCNHCRMDFENLPLLEAHKRCCHGQVESQNREMPGLSKFPKILPRHVETDRLQESAGNQRAQPGKTISVEQPGGKALGPIVLVLAPQGVSLPVLQPSPVLTPGTTVLKLPLTATPLNQVTTPLKVRIPSASRASACRTAVRTSRRTKASSSGCAFVTIQTDPPGQGVAGDPATAGTEANTRSTGNRFLWMNHLPIKMQKSLSSAQWNKEDTQKEGRMR
ncbi:zinc finger protein 260-like [Scleropages formosus]|uniref:zinc finger protein 260-like n=1 Tax=Scleropages formosus TaxID=113540 RepID=UPI0010FAAB73|nr:zinc finger protein 260-like [Scleropages formosus]